MQQSSSLGDFDDDQMVHRASRNTCEIEEVEEKEKEKENETVEVKKKKEKEQDEEDDKDVYVAIGNSKSSMDALLWALRHVVDSSSFVYLVHVFPAVHHIPTPLGMMPKSQLSKQQVESHMDKVRTKRREMLHKFSNMCHNSKVDFHLIESDEIVNAVLELIPVVNIKMLIVGTSKSNLSRKWTRGSTKAEQIQKRAPSYCEVKIICDGKEIGITDGMPQSSPSSSTKNTSEERTPLSSSLPDNANITNNDEEEQKNNNNNVKHCICFPL